VRAEVCCSRASRGYVAQIAFVILLTLRIVGCKMKPSYQLFSTGDAFYFVKIVLLQFHIHRQIPAREMRVAVELVAPGDFGSLAGICVV